MERNVLEWFHLADERTAQMVLRYARHYGAEEASIVQLDDESWRVQVDMLPMEIQRIYGYIDGLARFEPQD